MGNCLEELEFFPGSVDKMQIEFRQDKLKFDDLR